jgi:hypothetical protein
MASSGAAQRTHRQKRSLPGAFSPRGMSALPSKADINRGGSHVRFVPCVDGSELARTFFTPAGWSVQPCVRPFGAAHMTAGHNALRGSGPGQNRAFKDAVALMGCSDRRIDRLCITCCSSSQPSHHRGRCDLVRPLTRPGSHPPKVFYGLLCARRERPHRRRVSLRPRVTPYHKRS